MKPPEYLPCSLLVNIHAVTIRKPLSLAYDFRSQLHFRAPLLRLHMPFSSSPASTGAANEAHVCTDPRVRGQAAFVTLCLVTSLAVPCPARDFIFLLQIHKITLNTYMYHNFIIQSSADGH